MTIAATYDLRNRISILIFVKQFLLCFVKGFIEALTSLLVLSVGDLTLLQTMKWQSAESSCLEGK